MLDKSARSRTRRTFLKLVPAAVSAGLAAPHAQASRTEPQGDVFLAPSTSQSVTTSNLTGHPAVTVNAGFADGLPVGLMVTGRLYDEATVLAVAAGYERARGPLTDRPPIARSAPTAAAAVRLRRAAWVHE